jgi:hypothetical protein
MERAVRTLVAALSFFSAATGWCREEEEEEKFCHC